MFFCLSALRRLALASAFVSSVAIAQTALIFPVMTFDPYPVANATPMADGDLNGDGTIDTVYVSVSSGLPATSTITSSLNSKTGSAPSIVAATQLSCTINSVQLADLNKDGRLDAVATCAEGVVAVMQGNGDGSFQSASTYTVASAAKAVAADLNGDGSPDVIVATATGNTTSTFAVLLNQGGTGPIRLGSPTIFGGAYGSSQLIAGDINGDGKPDLIAGGIFMTSPSPGAGIFYGNGDGTFKTPSIFDRTSSISTLGDFNGDGVMDIADVSNALNAGLPSLVNISFSGSTTNTSVSLFMGIVSLHALDINGDGHMDLVVAGSTTTVLLGDGSGNLTVGRSYATPGTYYGARTTRDGKTNLVFTTARGFYTLTGNGDGSFSGIPALFPVGAAATADLNRDGLTDLASITPDFGLTYSAIERGDGAFLRLSGAPNQLNGFPVLADFDGDGTVDLVQIGNTNGQPFGQSSVIWEKGGGDGSFTGNKYSTINALNTVSAAAADFDGDGKTDLVVSNAEAGNIRSNLLLVQGNGDGTFAAASGPFATFAAVVSAKVLTVDLNGDGKLDIVWGNNAYLNQGGGNFSPTPFSTQATAMAVGDLDGDGVPDVVLTDNTIHHGNGDGTFQTAAFYTIPTPTGSTSISAAIGDLNGDGHADVVIQYMADMAGLSVALSDRQGGLIADKNLYITGDKTPIAGTLARLGNQAPTLPNDNRWDYVAFANGAAVSLLNQTNPVPTPPPLLPTKLVLTASTTSAVPQQQVTLSLTLTGVLPTGTVTLTGADGKVVGKVFMGLGFGAAVQTSFATSGTYTVTATYAGDGVNAPATSNPVTITVAKYSSSIQLQLPTTYYVGRTVALQAHVTGFSPSGLVSFTVGNTMIGTAPLSAETAGSPFTAILPYVFTSAGSYTITASFPGDDFDLPTTSPATTVSAIPGPDFVITATPSSNTVKVGDTANYTLNFTGVNGYSGTVTVTCDDCAPANIVVGSQPTSLQFSVIAPAPQTSRPNILIYGGAQAALLIMFGWKRRWRRMGRRLHLSTLAVLLAIGLGCMSGCSSGSGSTTPPSTYNIVITGTDTFIPITHTVTLQLVVTQ